MRRAFRAGLLVGVVIGFALGGGPVPAQTITALAPVEIVLDGRQELVGVAVAADGTLYVSDRFAGVVYRLAPSGSLVAAVTGLDRPAGLALDGEGRLLIAEEQAGRILRLEPAGTLTVLATGIKTPRWLAVSPDGALYVGAHRLTAPDGADVSEGREILRLVPGVGLTVVATGIRRLEGLVRLNGTLVAATKGLESEADSPGKLLQYPILADGSLGPPVAWVNTGLKQPVGLVLDRLAALYVSSKEVSTDIDTAKRAIGKVHPDAHLSSFAEHLSDPQGVALGPEGSLSLADGKAGRLLRFRAPPAPVLTALPAFTNQSPLALSGTTEPNARADLFVNDAATATTGIADAAGAFALTVPLAPNAESTFQIFATTHAGDGLTAAPVEVTILHDDQPPAVALLQPSAGGFVRQTVSVQARASDGGSHVASLTLSAGAHPLTPSLSPTPPAPTVTATADWNTTAVADGTHTLSAAATDQAGNAATATRSVLVDNTPPETTITGGPAGEISVTEATFTFTGSDNLTPVANLVFSWSLDGGPFTAFSIPTTATFTGLAEGAHTFQVRARDLAGNEDPTPAQRVFTVALGPAITAVDPPSGAIGTLVTITGARFEPGSTQVAFNGVAGVLRSLTASTATTTVPIGATTGNLTLTTSRGSATRAFTVTTRGDFTLTVAPASLPAVQGTSVEVRVDAPASGSYTGLVTLSTGALPAGVSATFSVPALAPNGTAILRLTPTASTPLGPSAITVTGSAAIDGRVVTRSASTTLDVLAPGQTFLAGQVRDEQDHPLAGVRISLGGATLTPLGTTDQGGNFLIPLSVTWSQTLLIDGSALNTATTFYPAVPVSVTIQPGVVNGLGFVARLTATSAAKLTPIPPGQDTVLTDPELPGFSVTIPAGVQIIGWDGQPNTQIGVTPIPLERSPLPPLPAGLTARQVYLFSFGKVGGGLPTGNVVIDTPNDAGADPGERIDLYFFNEAPDGTAPNQWQKYGTGTVSADGTRIVTDVNPATGKPYGIPRFCCGARANVWVSTSEQVRDRQAKGGEPVDLPTGRFTVRQTDLVLGPIVIQRVYRSENPRFEVKLGAGWNLAGYDHQIVRTTTGLALLWDGQSAYPFAPTGAGRWENTTEPFLRGAVITANLSLNFAFILRFKDGTVYLFNSPDGGPRSILTSITDGTGQSNNLRIERSVVGITRIVDERANLPFGRALTFSYDDRSRLSAITDPLGRAVRYTYVDDRAILAAVTDPAGGVTRYTYDPNIRRILSITDPRGIAYLTNEYDGNNRVVRQTQADGGVWTFAYQTVGNAVVATTVTDPRGHPTTYRFNGQGFTVSQTDALGQTTAFEYEPGSNFLRATTDPLGRVTRFTYDSLGNVTTITDPGGQTRTFSYEPTFNRVTSITDPLGQVTRFEYDFRRNLTALVDPLGARTTITYNSFGQPLSTTDPLGHTTTFAYDSVGNLITLTDPLGHATRRTYDAVSRLLAQTDPRGRTTRFAYDPLNRLTQLTDADAGLTQFAYDGNGNLLTVTDARGNAITHAYDSMDRLATRTDPVGAMESFGYDGVGNLLQHTDRKGQVGTFSYDPLNRRTGASYADGTTTSLTYDAAGRLLQASDSVGSTILNQYDDLERLIAQSTGLGTITYQYDALGRRTRMDAPGQASVFYGYDAGSRLRTITRAPLNPVTIDYDALGRRTLLTLPNGVSTEYQYDNASRLTALIYRNALGLLGDLSYQYDAGGNRIRVGGSFARTLLPDPVPSATYDAANRQLAFGDKTLTYDANGNVGAVADLSGTTTLSWDARDRLATLASSGAMASFTYDPLGRRLAKTINGQFNQFIYDGLDIVQQLDTLGTTSYLRSLSIDEALALTNRNGTYFSIYDPLGSILAATDASASPVVQYTYEPFGRTSSTDPSFPNPFQFTGREHDELTGLYFLRARYYSPTLHRLISEDPVRRHGINDSPYAYVDNQPTLLVDPYGEFPLFVPILFAAGLFGAIENGIIAYGQGQSASQIGKQAAIGFGAGVVGGVAGLLVGGATGNPLIIGAASNAAFGLTNSFLQGGVPSVGQLFTDAAVGAAAGGLAGKLVPKVPGPVPNLFSPRPISKYGPKSLQILKAAGLGGELGVLGDLAIDMAKAQPAFANELISGRQK